MDDHRSTGNGQHSSVWLAAMFRAGGRTHSEPVFAGDVWCELLRAAPDGRPLTNDEVPDNNRQTYPYDGSSVASLTRVARAE